MSQIIQKPQKSKDFAGKTRRNGTRRRNEDKEKFEESVKNEDKTNRGGEEGYKKEMNAEPPQAEDEPETRRVRQTVNIQQSAR